MGGTANALARWARDPAFYRHRVFQGRVLEIGPGHEPLAKYADQFPRLTAYTCVDHNPLERHGAEWLAGDATLLASVGDRTFDVVYASHVLEHVLNPTLTLARWWDKVAPGGKLVVMVPSWMLYERLRWPPHLNGDHKSAWVLALTGAPLPFIRGLVNEVTALPRAILLRALTLDEGWAHDLYDQTADGTCESSLEVVLHKAWA